jgi:hypothetical protein
VQVGISGDDYYPQNKPICNLYSTMTRIDKAKRERMDGYNDILKHHNIVLSEEHLINLDHAILHRPKGMEGNDIIDKIIEKHKQERKAARKPIKREMRAVHKCTKHSKRIVKTYSSVTLCAKEEFGDIKYKAAIINVCANRAKSYKGWVFKYASE